MSDLLAALRPSKGETRDLVALLTLLVLGIIGFRTTFAGHEELLTGVPAVLLGAAVAYVLSKRSLGLLPSVAIATVVFAFFATPLAVPSLGIARVLPTPASMDGIVVGLVSGWVRLLTSLPPAGEAGNLLMVPYAVGYVGGSVTIAAAMRWTGPPVAAVGPLVVLVVSVLFGTRRPASLLLQGIAFALVLIAWLAIRESRRRAVVVSQVGRQRQVAGAAMLAMVGLVGFGLGPLVPGVDDAPRFVLRDRIEPPFDPLAEPSPLAGFRLYTGEEEREEPVLEVTGLPLGVPVRLAVLDDYDGLVWRATGSGGPVSGRFVRIGESIPDPTDGTPATVEVEVLAPHNVWLPTVGDVVRVDFGDDARRDDMRFNQETETAAVPGGVRPGERYVLDVIVPDSTAPATLAGLSLDPQFGGSTDEFPTEIVEIGAQLRGSAQAPYAVVEELGRRLREDGAYSDGTGAVQTPPGHSLARLARFLGAPQWVGNGEQYAAALGLLARAQGIPARVVMGYLPDSSGGTVTIDGADVAAWVEIPLTGAGWVPVFATPSEDQLPDPSVQPRPRPLEPEPQPPPPAVDSPPAELPQDLGEGENSDGEEDEEEEDGDRFPWAAVLLAVGGVAGLLVAPPLLVLWAKRRRRRRRMERGSPAERAAGGWDETLDQALDVGRPVQRQANRTEALTVLVVPSAERLARMTNTATFGGRDVGQPELEELWAQVDVVTAELKRDLTRRERLRAALSLRSLRAGRRRRRR